MTQRTITALLRMKHTVIEQVESKQIKVVQGAELLGMSRQGLGKLRRQYRRFGERALSGLKRGPKRWHRPANRTSEEVEEMVVRYRGDHPIEGPKTITWRLQDERGISIPAITIARILKRRGLIPLHEKRKTKREWKEVTVDHPGERIQIDSYQPWGRCGRIIFEATDVYSRWTFGWVCEAATMLNASIFIDMLVARAPFIIGIAQPDNGSEFKKLFQQALRRHNIAFDPIPPYAPNCNGRVERMHRSSKYEFYLTIPYWLPLSDLNYRAALYYQDFNWKRRHQGKGMNMQTPIQKIISYLQSSLQNNLPRYGNLTLIQYKIFDKR